MAFPLTSNPLTPNPLSLDDIIGDIYNAASELSEVDFEQLQTDLYALHESPIDLNNTSDEELSQLYFLSPQQIDEILTYADKHPFESLYELRLIHSLADYEIRDLLPFVQIKNQQSKIENPLYPKEVFAKAHHEIITRVDARNIEGYEGTDPIYTQFRYRFDFRRRVTFGAQLRRPAGGAARDLQYGAYLQLKDIAPHLHTLVAGNFQASFGQGLVFAPVFHAGKSMYVTSVGQQREGLRYYSSVDGAGLHGAGATLRWNWGKQTRLDVSALYSMKRANDSTWHHLVGANLTLRHKRLELQLTAAENIWVDSIYPYRNAAYNQHYFRGSNQAVLGASFRYNHGWFDLFAEVATAQNHEIINQQSPYGASRSEEIKNQKWGIGTIVGCRFYPTNGVSLLALYRYYSPYFDNALGYAFSETSRLGDENGGYLGFEITRLRNWRFSGYGDVFYFTGPKYGIPQSPTLGYDALAEAQYHSNQKSEIKNQKYWLALRLRAKQKGEQPIYSARAIFDWQHGGWSLRTTVDFNLTNQKSKIENQKSDIPYGLSLAQDVAYDFSTPYTLHPTPLSIRLRLQFFDARDWTNRIYLYEHDVLYAYSIPAVYGLGGRAYLCLRWQIIPQLALYFRASETIYAKQWAAEHSRPFTRTDLHLLLRATF
ncbi:MAG: helix-hairpin-helix domain-containing protein [Paludibacteraceae bacterium]|nr:helix-hairpin-helix domain-containing protein [Paludibacteraceae bacterium]